MIDDDVRKICQRNFVSDSFDRYLDNKICLKTKDRKQKNKLSKKWFKWKGWTENLEFPTNNKVYNNHWRHLSDWTMPNNKSEFLIYTIKL
jgi:hypothetical protein